MSEIYVGGFQSEYMSTGGATPPDDSAIKNRLQSMDSFDFEHLVADLWERQGWNTEVEQQAGDAGVDVRATQNTPYQQKILIQAKRYSGSNSVGGPDVQQYASLKHQEESVDKVLIVTSGQFTSAAVERANELNVKLIDGDDLVSLINQFDATELVETYAEVIPTASSGRASDTQDTAPSEVSREIDIASGKKKKSGISISELPRYHYVLYIGGVLFVGGVAIHPIVQLIGLSVAWIAFFADAAQLKNADTEWTPSYILGFFGIFAAFLYLPYYHIRRRTANTSKN